MEHFITSEGLQLYHHALFLDKQYIDKLITAFHKSDKMNCIM